MTEGYEFRKRVAVIGGGAAGMMAAGTALSEGADVTLFEHTDRLGKKLAITGKGRCNVTNDCSVNEFLENVTRNHKFLYTALYRFPPEKTINFFEALGVELKTERGQRVFPKNDKAKTIVDALRRYCKDAKTLFENVTSVKKAQDGTLEVKTLKGSYQFDSVILATGGRSYPLTGSDGSGYRLAMKLGHSITELSPSLVPIESTSRLCTKMMGLSLKNVAIKAKDKIGNTVFSDFGEMMFTHFGITGPMVLSLSAHIDAKDLDGMTLSIDLKPALDEKTLDTRILSDFSKNNNKDLLNSLGALLPSKMIEPFIEYCGIDPRKKVNSITREERGIMIKALKGFSIPLSKLRPIEEAIITRGGINVKEIDPRTMESKICDGVYFAGEMIDVDAYTGGFNLQIAFSTGFIAGENASKLY